MMKADLLLKPLVSTDIVLLILRFGTGLLLFVNHGLEKILRFNQMLEIFPDPLGVSPVVSLVFASIADVLCSVLLMLGFLTRVSSFLVFVNLIVAFIFVHHSKVGEIHGELIILYTIAMAIIFFYGPGSISVDKIVSTKNTIL